MGFCVILGCLELEKQNVSNKGAERGAGFFYFLVFDKAFVGIVHTGPWVLGTTSQRIRGG